MTHGRRCYDGLRMGPPASLRPAWTLATGAIVRRGSLLALLVLAERILTPVAAWVLFTRPLGVKIAVSTALGVVFTARAFLVRSFSARTEADLMDRAIGSVLDGDVLQASVLPGEDARAELGQGVYMSALLLSQVVPAVLADLVAALLLTVVIVCVEPVRLVLGAAVLMGVAAIGLVFARGRLRSNARLVWELHDALQETMVDALEGRLEIVASGEREAFAKRAHERAHAWGVAGVRMATSSLISGRIPMLASAFAVAVAVTIDSSWHGALAVPLADMALFASVTPALAGVGQGMLAVVQTQHWAQLVASVLQGALPRRNLGRMPPLSEPIAFEGVFFRYESADIDALTAIEFAWRDERVVALSGANGSGKSTWLRLLLALGTPRAGKIRVGAADLAEVDGDDWRRSIAFLPQRPYLPMRSQVGATVRLLAPTASDSRITSALDQVGLLETLRRLNPEPLAVRIDTLSVGERQRVALARMLCRDASLFVFDEPDANLDRAGIALVADLVRTLSRDRKVILAAHTPELIAVADRVVELDRGRILRDERRSAGA